MGAGGVADDEVGNGGYGEVLETACGDASGAPGLGPGGGVAARGAFPFDGVVVDGVFEHGELTAGTRPQALELGNYAVRTAGAVVVDHQQAQFGVGGVESAQAVAPVEIAEGQHGSARTVVDEALQQVVVALCQGRGPHGGADEFQQRIGAQGVAPGIVGSDDQQRRHKIIGIIGHIAPYGAVGGEGTGGETVGAEKGEK